MKKSIFLVTAALMSIFLLAACADAGETSSAGPDGTPGTSDDIIVETTDEVIGDENPDLTNPTDTTGGLGVVTPEVTQPATTDTAPTLDATEPVTSTTGGGVSGGVSSLDDDKRDAGRLSFLLDYEVHSSDHEVIGEVEDLVLNLETGKVDYIIVGVGGFLGIGEKEVAIPCALFEFPAATAVGSDASDDDTDDSDASDDAGEYFLTLNLTKEDLEAAPDWDPAVLPDLGDPAGDYDVEIRGYWVDFDTSVDTSMDTSTTTDTTVVAGKLQGVILASDAIGFNIQNSAGEDVAEVQDIVIDTTTCEIKYVIVSYDDETEGAVLIPVPPAAFMLDAEANAIVLADADTDFVDAPRFTDDDFPYTLDVDWDDDVRTFWETRIVAPATSPY